MPLFKACSFAVRDGRARCRKEAGKCDNHTLGSVAWEKAPRPTTVLVKINLNEDWEFAFRQAGVQSNNRSFERATQLELQRVEEAKDLGRNAYAIRVSAGRDSGMPEDADTGCPVFGKDGLADLNVGNLEDMIRELWSCGFRFTRASLLKREHKPPTRLEMEFAVQDNNAGEKPKFTKFPWPLFWRFLATTFNKVDVWANPKKDDGKVVHTVNCGRRENAVKPRYRLSYSGGDWDAVEIVSAAAK